MYSMWYFRTRGISPTPELASGRRWHCGC